LACIEGDIAEILLGVAKRLEQYQPIQ